MMADLKTSGSQRSRMTCAAIAAFLLPVAFALPPSDAVTLFGGVSHSRVLPPVPQRYLSPERGRVDQTVEAPRQAPVGTIAPSPPPASPAAEVLPPEKVVWIPVPNWLAGTWVKQGDLTVSYTDVRTGVTRPANEWTQNYQTAVWGNQVDAQGNVWQGYVLPTQIPGLSNGKTVTFIVVNGQPEVSPPGHWVARDHNVVIERAGGEIVDAFQQETLNDLFVSPSGQLENDASTRDFTNQGQPLRQGMLVSTYTKVGPYHIVEFQNGVDMLKSLNEYLRSHNMSQLVRTGK